MDVKLVLLVVVAIGFLVDNSAADLIWHNDEIPYSADARCYRGHSYYTNHDTPNDTTINYDENVHSLLDFKSETTCFFCICSSSGHAASCIARHLWFCNYLRYLRSDKAGRDMYADIFQQDRPAYFRQLSWRLRRTMDNSMFNIIRQGVHDGYVAKTKESTPVCVAFVSEYTDCNQENKCDGCTKCICTADGQWSCKSIQECEDEDVYIDEKTFDTAVAKMERDLQYESMMKKEEPRISDHLVPRPGEVKDNSDELSAMASYDDPVLKLQQLFRRTRSVSTKNNQNTHDATDKMNKKRITRNSEKHNNTIKFYSTVDELNEDTLKNSNISGTLQAKKIDLNSIPNMTRRTNSIDTKNKSLQIDFNQAAAYNHINDNKIDIADLNTKFDSSHENLNILLGNETQNSKNGELSKLVVNELKPGTEVVGDKRAPVTSNITFTSENDTLTAMAYIAGNLLNKLWNMEKDTSGSLLATDEMKQEKISDLLDLFKEPLNLRQESFLKKALERLSSTIDKDKDIKNVTICETIDEATSLIDNFNNSYDKEKPSEVIKDPLPCKQNDKEEKINKIDNQATLKAIEKINNVLGLMRKFESLQQNLSLIKNESNSNFEILNNFTEPISKKLVANSLTKDEANSLNTFGNILDKITKFLLPKNNGKKTRQLIRNKNILSDSNDKDSKLLKMYNIDLSNATLTAKDRIILDYLTHIKNSPDCALNKKHQNKDDTPLPTIESNILLNLSEFYKIKSFTDLVNLIQTPKPKTEVINETEKKSMLRTATEPASNAAASTTISITTTTEQSQKFASTKEKLKAHLKSIIEDLIELQSAKGIAPRGNIRIADALPCIYNIMNAGKDIYKDLNKENNPPANIIDIFNALKDDMKKIKTRRTDSIMKVRPKSVVVLERIINNFGQKQKPQTRRSGGFPDIDGLKKTMNKLQNISSLYKNQALYVEVPAAERLMLLKALAADIKHNVAALEGIKMIFKNVTQLPPDQYQDISTFVLNSAKNISLDEKVINKLEKIGRPGTNKYIPGNIKTSSGLARLVAPTKPLAMFSGGVNHDDNLKITRNQIISHLIRNKMKMYMNLKEARELDVNNDINYNIAKRVIFYLDNGNITLAHELFKVLMAQKDDDSHLNDSSEFDSKIANTPLRRHSEPRLKPLIQFEEPKSFEKDHMKWMNNDHLIKQLLNIKTLQA